MEKTHLIGRFIEKELFITATPQRVFQALTEKADLERWFVQKAEVDVRPGGAIRLEWRPDAVEIGKILVLEPPHRLSYSWEALEPRTPVEKSSREGSSSKSSIRKMNLVQC